jgi:hypothetical protein
VLELLLCLLPRVAPEHAGWFGEVRLVGVSELGRSADRDSGQASARECLPEKPYKKKDRGVRKLKFTSL